MVAVLKPRPHIRFPRETPSRPFIPPGDKDLAGGFEEVGSRSGNHVSGIEPVQMGCMAMMRVCFLVILDPFLNASGFRANANRGETRQGRFTFFPEVGIDIERRARVDAVGQQIVNDLKIHGRAEGQ